MHGRDTNSIIPPHCATILVGVLYDAHSTCHATASLWKMPLTALVVYIFCSLIERTWAANVCYSLYVRHFTQTRVPSSSRAHMTRRSTYYHCFATPGQLYTMAKRSKHADHQAWIDASIPFTKPKRKKGQLIFISLLCKDHLIYLLFLRSFFFVVLVYMHLDLNTFLL